MATVVKPLFRSVGSAEADPPATLTPVAGAVTWTPSTDGLNASLTLAVNTTITIDTTGLDAGDDLELLVIQPVAGNCELVFPTTCLLTPGPKLEASAATAYRFRFDGTNLQCAGMPIRTKTLTGTSYTVTRQDHGTNIVFTSASAVAVTLPALASFPGLRFSTIQSGAGTVTTTRAGADTIRGIVAGTGQTSYAQVQDETVDWYASTSNWWLT